MAIENRHQSSAASRIGWGAALLLVAYLALVVASAIAIGRHGESLGAGPRDVAHRMALCLLILETLALAVGVPFLAASVRARRGLRAAGGFLLPVLGIEAISVAACAIAARGALSGAALVWAQVFLLAFAFLVAALVAFFRGIGLRATTGQLLASALALAMVGNVFYANPLIEGLRGEGTRTFALNAALWTNPWMIVAGSILEEDPLRATELYAWSVIKYYGFRYPAAGLKGVPGRALCTSAAYGGLALALCLAGRALRRPPRGLDSTCPEEGQALSGGAARVQ